MGFRRYAKIQKVQTAGKLRFKLLFNLYYTTRDGREFVVKKGFISDLGSIPKIFWILVSPHGFPSAYILHDYFCEQDWISRAEGDRLLKEALIASNAKSWKVKIIYFGVKTYAKIARKK